MTQIMHRNIKGFPVRQRTDNMFINATDTLKAYNRMRGPENNIKYLPDYLRLSSTQEFMRVIENTEDPLYLKPDKLIITQRGKYGGTYMHPYLYIDFCMWLSPLFKYWAVGVVHDKLIQLRKDNVDAYKRLTRAIKTHIPGGHQKYSNEIMMINELAYGRQVKDRRDISDEDELNLLKQLQISDEFLIQKGVTDFNQRRNTLRKLKKLLNWK